ncbi:unnamed protein product [Pieris macdunnoughi]|uniref:Uncharacterized protein n=1 Tax=Pieris macdunnoughi TaxID=345717 RepID=A0A821U902_9NEOP|nr:unnamed protein product [Pieris macdunnoughi]
MHPTGAASLPAAPEAEVQAMHSMDWLFKKERIYLLAQFWQQVECRIPIALGARMCPVLAKNTLSHGNDPRFAID